MGEIFKREKAIGDLPFTGERLTSATHGQIEIEHLHRYFLAREHCRGLDILDVASGEGYGSAYLAQVARTVTGVDIDAGSIAHAKESYSSANLRYIQGTATEIPLISASIDVVVSFETIEHFYEHNLFLQEVKRVLRPGGLFICSTPDRDIYSPLDSGANPYHVHELTHSEYESLLVGHFENVKVLFQRALVGSVIISDGPASVKSEHTIFEKRGSDYFEASHGPTRSMYMLSFATDGELPNLGLSIYIDESRPSPAADRVVYEKLLNDIKDLQSLSSNHQLHLTAAHNELECYRSNATQVESQLREYQLAFKNASKIAENLDEDLKLKTRREEASKKKNISHINYALNKDCDVNYQENPLGLGIYKRSVFDWADMDALLSIADALCPRSILRDLYLSGSEEYARIGLRIRHPLSRRLRIARWRAFQKTKENLKRLDTLFDPDYYIDSNRDLSFANVHPLKHFLEVGWQEGRDPSPLFSISWYETQSSMVSNQDPLSHFLMSAESNYQSTHPLFDADYYVQSASKRGVSVVGIPLVHFLWIGSQLNIDPHPLFDTEGYLKQTLTLGYIPDNALLDYLLSGYKRGLKPNPAFDPAYYLKANVDVQTSGMEPLTHFVVAGVKEMRATSAEFDPAAYLSNYPDVRTAGADPLRHFLEYGRREGRVATAIPLLQAADLSAPIKPLVYNTDVIVDVIVPVYRGMPETKRCVESVLKSFKLNKTPARLVLIDDCSPELALREYLDQLNEESCAAIVRNKRNLGFVRSVNHGIINAGDADVILLNSDTEVHGDWIDRMVSHAYREQGIGTVTASSNNATIFSYPSTPGTSTLPLGETTNSLDCAFRDANLGLSIDVPTAHGFCMYIRRRCINDVGLFDQEAFGRGYGEENDFSLRATANGWRNLLATDTFVYHVGEVSFGHDSNPAREKAAEILRNLYPTYELAVHRFTKLKLADGARFKVTAMRVRQNSKKVILMVMHGLGGGTEKHVQELVSSLPSNFVSLILVPQKLDVDKIVCDLQIRDGGNHFQHRFEAQTVSELVEVINMFKPSRAHVHHTFGFVNEINAFLNLLGVPYDVTIHDYMMICPRINLLKPDNSFCDVGDAVECLSCLSESPHAQTSDILSWRLEHERLLLNASRVICPSQDTADRMNSVIHRDYLVALHETQEPLNSEIISPNLSAEEPMRIAVIGRVSKHKGAIFIRDCINAWFKSGLRFNLIIIGEVESECLYLFKDLDTLVHITGSYEVEYLQGIIDITDPHLIFYPQRWPETYSYTLSEGIKSKRPLLVPDIGSFSERVSGRNWVWVYDFASSPEDLAVKLLALRHQHLELKSPPEPIQLETSRSNDNFYVSDYLGHWS